MRAKFLPTALAFLLTIVVLSVIFKESIVILNSKLVSIDYDIGKIVIEMAHLLFVLCISALLLWLFSNYKSIFDEVSMGARKSSAFYGSILGLYICILIVFSNSFFGPLLSEYLNIDDMRPRDAMVLAVAIIGGCQIIFWLAWWLRRK